MKNPFYMRMNISHHSISRSYDALMGDKPAFENVELIWNKIRIPKHRFLLWVVEHRKLLTRERLRRVGVHCDEINCVLCNKQMLENDTHLFAACEVTTELWRRTPNWLGINIALSEVPNTL